MADPALTWHPGSVLPYASLWHTTLRTCVLNALHPRDLPARLATYPATVELIENRSDVDVMALAHALGEPAEAFRWASMGRLPLWLTRALVVPRPRLCFACLAAGYHAALYSIALLDACPIHGTPLVDTCHCGAPLSAKLRSLADYLTAGSCRCGRLHFFTRDTCRQPTLTAAATRALDPVAAWLDAMSGLIRSRRLEDALRQQAPGSHEWLVDAADTLGVTYPACFRTVPPARVEKVECDTRFTADLLHRRLPQPTGARKDERRSCWPGDPVATVYRAMARHVRRHIAPGSARWVADFVDACDPLVIGERLCGNARAHQAFVELLWGRAVELGIEQHRWTGQPPPAVAMGHLTQSVAADCLVCGAEGVDAAARHWLACHAARVSLVAAWCDAQASATAAARSGLADWATSASSESWQGSAWLARVTPEGPSFVAMIHPNWAAAHRSDKATRQAADVARRQARLDTMWAANRGACLTWSDDTGWHVIDAIAPADLDLRHRKLLGLPDGRPWCWLYQALDGRFVARWHSARLQVAAATPRAALTGLRRCATSYQQICRVALPFPRSAPVITAEPMAARQAAAYRELVANIKADGAFWRKARRLAAAARLYRITRAMADQTRRERE